jgi:ABC-2 type transport system permease protein
MPLVLMAFLKPAYRPVLIGKGHPGANGAEQAVPGAAVTFSFFWIQQVGLSFFREHGWGTWDRLRASPARPLQILGGKAAPSVAAVALQLAVVFAAGALIFDLHVRGTVGALVPVGLALALALVALSVAFVAVCSTFNQVVTLAALGAMLLSGLGGALTPYSVLPGWARAVAPATPSYWAMRGFRSVIFGSGWGSVVLPTLILMAFAAGFAAVATARFRFTDTKTYTA